VGSDPEVLKLYRSIVLDDEWRHGRVRVCVRREISLVVKLIVLIVTQVFVRVRLLETQHYLVREAKGDVHSCGIDSSKACFKWVVHIDRLKLLVIREELEQERVRILDDKHADISTTFIMTHLSLTNNVFVNLRHPSDEHGSVLG
jgi:hypothetical protein